MCGQTRDSPEWKSMGDFSEGISVQRYRWFHFTDSKCPEGFDSSDARPGNWLRRSIHRDLRAGHIPEDMAAGKCPQGSTRRKYRRVIWLRQSIHKNLPAGHILEGFAQTFSLRDITVDRRSSKNYRNKF
jgi:hypothetical protein